MLTQTAGVLLTNSGTNGSASLLSMLLPFVILIAVFYFLLIRPENKKKKAAAKMRSELAVLHHPGIFVGSRIGFNVILQFLGQRVAGLIPLS